MDHRKAMAFVKEAKITILFIWSVSASAAMGQGGLVYFGNDVLPSPPDRLVRTPDGSPLVGTNFMAELLYGPSDCSLTAAGNSARFRVPTTPFPGTWAGGYRTIVGFSSGQTVRLKVRFWDSNYGGTYEMAQAAGGWFDDTALFNYRVPSNSANPTNYYMYEFLPPRLPGCSSNPVMICEQPSDRMVTAGSAVLLTAKAVNACRYGWLLNGTNLGTVSGSASMLVPNIQTNQSGMYQFLAGNADTWTTSAVARLAVLLPGELGLARQINNQFRFYVAGTNNSSLAVETTTNLGLAPWQPVLTNTPPFWFTNPAPAADRQRFYRSVLR